jgi:hypothetical protein
MDVEELMHKLRGLLSELGADTRETAERPYVALVLDSLTSAVNLVRAAELTIAAGASLATVDAMLREHMLGRMQREAVFMGRLAEQPAAKMEAMVRARREPNARKRKARTQPGVGWAPGH